MKLRCHLESVETDMEVLFDRASTTIAVELVDGDAHFMRHKFTDRADVEGLRDFLDTVLCHWPAAEDAETE